MSISFSYVKDSYKVPAQKYREVIIDGKRGVITEDMGNYIGVHFYDNPTYRAQPCHPTWQVEYLDSFNFNPPIKKLSRSQKRYVEYIESDSDLTFKQWLGIK